MAQRSLELEAGAADLCGPLSRSLSEAWGDLPAEWRALGGGLDEHARRVTARVEADAGQGAVAPARPFRAFELVRPDEVRLVLVGQDPYPRPGDANGLAFCSLQGVPHSMRNVFAALEAAFPGFRRPPVADLAHWARQGVLLLNAALTVRVGEAGSHLKHGWEEWTGGLLRALYSSRLAADREVPVAWLWGKPAQQFFDSAMAGLPVPAERVLRARHPSNDYRKEFVGQAGGHLARLETLLQPPIRW
jgi:uracil-DNA glycosylase